jgi:hypothetical protein
MSLVSPLSNDLHEVSMSRVLLQGNSDIWKFSGPLSDKFILHKLAIPSYPNSLHQSRLTCSCLHTRFLLTISLQKGCCLKKASLGDPGLLMVHSRSLSDGWWMLGEGGALEEMSRYGAAQY